MRYLQLALLISLIASPAFAQENESGESSEQWREICTRYSGLAAQVMENRQLGVSMSQMMDLASDEPIMEEMVMSAYNMPRYSTEQHQQRSISDFRDEWYLKCAQSLRQQEGEGEND